MYWLEFLQIAVAHLLAVASPGPDFAVVLRQSVTAGSRAGLWTSAGVGCGILLHVAYSLAGVALVVSQSPALFAALKWLAAAYLLYLGLRSLGVFRRGGAAAGEQPPAAAFSRWRAFALGFITNGLNPKATLFFLALFTVVLAPNLPIAVQLAFGAYLALATFAWFAMLSVALGRPGARQFMLRAGSGFERLMGVVLIALAAQLVLAG